MKKNYLMIIDPQNDFCDIPKDNWPQFIENADSKPNTCTHQSPALPVAGADADMQRLSQFINNNLNQLTDITITLDSHHYFDIGHPGFWFQNDESQKEVAPFTQISADDVRQRRYLPRNEASYQRVLTYLEALEKNSRYNHMVWPEHCIIGTWGHNIHQSVLSACTKWEKQRQQPIHFVFKGLNCWTEHYSAVMAEVPDENDPASMVNQSFLNQIIMADKVYIAGEAGSHCVKATCEHIIKFLDKSVIRKIVLLTDCISPVSGFESAQIDIINQMQALGANVDSSSTII